jgi:hypothetical protein
MSVRPESIAPVPEDTARVAKAAFPKGSTYTQIRDVLGTLFNDEYFAELLPESQVFFPFLFTLASSSRYSRSRI